MESISKGMLPLGEDIVEDTAETEYIYHTGWALVLQQHLWSYPTLGTCHSGPETMCFYLYRDEGQQ